MSRGTEGVNQKGGVVVWIASNLHFSLQCISRRCAQSSSFYVVAAASHGSFLLRVKAGFALGTFVSCHRNAPSISHLVSYCSWPEPSDQVSSIDDRDCSPISNYYAVSGTVAAHIDQP